MKSSYLSTMRMAFVLFLWAILIGCGGGGSSEPPPPTTGTASGSLIVPPNNTVEVEPNDSIGEAQPVTATSKVSGEAAQGDPDFYRLEADVRVRITLTIAQGDPSRNNLNLILLDDSGTQLAASQGSDSLEVLETTQPGVFLVEVQVVQGSSAYVLSFESLRNPSETKVQMVPPEAEFVPGEILVKWKTRNQDVRVQRTIYAAEHELEHKMYLPDGVELMRLPGARQLLQQGVITTRRFVQQSQEEALKAETLDAIGRLRADPDVNYAEPNFIRKPAQRVPNDPLFDSQWHYRLINLPEAWDLTQGDNAIIAAVIDTGVFFGHEDFDDNGQSRLIPGFDFISDSIRAKDGDGIDPDASDPGDDPLNSNSSFHGTHVAGIVGAASDNAIGVAGVTWQTQIMPVRVLGVGGGTDADIAQAIRYAAGLPNSSGTVPAQRAHVINMSLAGPGFSITLHNAVQAARAEGVIIVAAAGNENSSTFVFPASLDGVISVSAVDINSGKASYSNFGSGIDVAAPGGDGADRVLSTISNDAGDSNLYESLQGTSMASPHVAGVIALMLAVNPNMTPTDIDQLLAGGHPETSIRITTDLGQSGRDDIFGHGLIDAAAAVNAANSIVGGSGTSPTGSSLAVSTAELDFGSSSSELSLDITSEGPDPLTITEITDDATWLTLDPSSGTTPPPLTVTVTVDRAGLAQGLHTATILITAETSPNQGSETATIDVLMQVGDSSSGNVGTVFVLVVDTDTFQTVQQASTDLAQSYTFTTPGTAAGTYTILAGTDRDDDGFICDLEDACGFFPEPVTITAGQNIPNIDFVVGELVSPQTTSSEFNLLRRAPFGRLR